MKININISNKATYTLITILILIAAGSFTFALNSGNPIIHGHTADEIEGGVGSGFAFSNNGSDFLTFTAPSTGKISIIAKGNFGSAPKCAGGNYAGTINLKINGIQKDSSYKYVFDNHCGSRTFTLLGLQEITAGEEYNVTLEGISSSYQSILVMSV